MTEFARATWRAAPLAVTLFALVAAGGSAQAAPLDREQLTRYARAHIALDAARDEFHATIARIHDDVGLARARAELDAKVAQIYLDNAITSEQYSEITLLISQNEQVRAIFEGIVRDLRAAAGTPPGDT
jgi:polyphosphate kinase